MSKQEALKSVSVGEILAGKYRVEKILGMGGMGVVVAATHLDLREMRAIKLIRPDAESDQSVERFLREARAVVRLRSEHVAEVYDVGRLESGNPYIVMELLEGQDLSTMLKARGPLPIEEAVLYVTQACHALAEAHAAGIVHRDLKPGNLFVTRRADGSPCVKVLDFGISKETKPQRPDPEMTGPKDLIGSPLYMSPEQMRSARKVDPRADVWALGAILYKLITGRAPFHAPTVPEIFALTLGKQVRPPSTLRPDIPGDLDAIILRCLDKQLQNRYFSAAELGAALIPHGPWDPMAAESAASLFRSTRRTSIPPAPPVNIEIDAPDREALLPAAHSMTQFMDTSEPMTGLARSHKIIRSGPIPSWSDARGRTLMRPGWFAFVVALSISSAFVGAVIVALVARTTNVSIANRPQEMPPPNQSPPPQIVTLVAPPVAASSSPMVEASANAIPIPIPPPVVSAPPKVIEKSQSPKRARGLASVEFAPRPPTSAETKALEPIPAKPESISPVVDDPFLQRN